MKPESSATPSVPGLGRSYGSFHAEALLQRLDVDPLEYINPERIAAFKKKGPSIDEQRDFAMSQMAVLHEERHFHDAFGTRAGISLFLMRTYVLDEFARTGLKLQKEKKRWPLPLTKPGNAALTGDVLKFVRLALAARSAGQRFQATPAITQEATDLPNPLPHVSRLQENDLKTTVYAFPARTAAKRGDGTTHPGLTHIPIALDAVMEGIAQAIQRSYAEVMWGDEVADSLFLLAGATLREIGTAGQPATYNATDLMVSRFLQNAGSPGFARTTLLKLSDHALGEGLVSVSWGADGNVQTQLVCPGHAFVDSLETLGAPAIKAGAVPAPANETYAEIRKNLASLPPWESVDAKYPRPLSDVLILRNWVASTIIVPLLDQRLETDHQVFSDWEVWFGRYGSLPMTPFRVRPNGVLLAKNVPERVQHAWITVVMLESMLRQLITGEPAVLCPRAHGLIPGLEKTNLAYSGSCSEYVDAELCGQYTEGMSIKSLPQCRFAEVLGMAGF